MQVIPVVDIRGGVAVAAVRGDRARYRPLETPLAPSTADPAAVALGLRTLFPFRTLYIADLDGIEGRGADLSTQARLAQAWRGGELWIDDGGLDSETTNVGVSPTLALPTRGREPVESLAHNAVPRPPSGRTGGGDSKRSEVIISHVLGSESQTSVEDFLRARERVEPSAPLSLDFRGDDFIGPPELLEDPALWPSRVIVMTLARVGSGEGPDLARLGMIIARAGRREVYAAGGVRNAEDLRALRGIGAAGALIASALHHGTVTAADLATFAASEA
jgi:uncharacterized protein related to proFAR isomerase